MKILRPGLYAAMLIMAASFTPTFGAEMVGSDASSSEVIANRGHRGDGGRHWSGQYRGHRGYSRHGGGFYYGYPRGTYYYGGYPDRYYYRNNPYYRGYYRSPYYYDNYPDSGVYLQFSL